jgi:hypothetical protein
MSELKIVNLTPHKLNILKKDGSTVTVEPSGQVIRVQQEEWSTLTDPYNLGCDFKITKVEFTGVDSLPMPEKDTIYVVSMLVRQALGDGRNDVFAVGEAVRDEVGRIIGCDGLRSTVSLPNVKQQFDPEIAMWVTDIAGKDLSFFYSRDEATAEAENYMVEAYDSADNTNHKTNRG